MMSASLLAKAGFAGAKIHWKVDSEILQLFASSDEVHAGRYLVLPASQAQLEEAVAGLLRDLENVRKCQMH